jgi:hypothetical protein
VDLGRCFVADGPLVEREVARFFVENVEWVRMDVVVGWYGEAGNDTATWWEVLWALVGRIKKGIEHAVLGAFNRVVVTLNMFVREDYTG